jgi:60S ribosomal subunit assembly/export protein LOC1
MMTILAMVNADKEGQIESKMMKARHLEAIREARKAEAEAREAMKKGSNDLENGQAEEEGVVWMNNEVV